MVSFDNIQISSGVIFKSNLIYKKVGLNDLRSIFPSCRNQLGNLFFKSIGLFVYGRYDVLKCFKVSSFFCITAKVDSKDTLALITCTFNKIFQKIILIFYIVVNSEHLKWKSSLARTCLKGLFCCKLLDQFVLSLPSLAVN